MAATILRPASAQLLPFQGTRTRSSRRTAKPNPKAQTEMIAIPTKRTGPAELRSGEPVAEAVAKTIAAGASAVLFNCSQPEVMEAARAAARDAVAASASARPDTPIGVYANAFAPEPPSDAPYAGISDIRPDLGPADYVGWVRRWLARGAGIVGGCCGIGPEHIAELRRVRDGGGVLPPPVPPAAAPF